MDDVRYYDDCDDSAVGDATCDSGRAASLVTSTSSSPEQQPQRAVLEGFSSPPNSAQSRHKNPSKMKLLVRSHALCEAASPPPDSPLPNSPCDEAANQCLDPAAEGLNKTRPRFKQIAGSSQCSLDSSASFVSFSLSRDSSGDLGASHTYTDNSGVDLHHFIVETLHRNYKDRTTLLRIEQEMIALVRDTKRTCHRFPAMSSYHRMLVHRVAAYFGLEHNVDQSGNCVMVSKARHTRLPNVPFKQYVREDIVLPEEPNKKSTNLKREVVSFDELSCTASAAGNENRALGAEARSRSFDHQERQDHHQGHGTAARGAASRNSRQERIFQAHNSWFSSQHQDRLLESAYATPSSQRSSNEDVRWPARTAKYSHGLLRPNRIPKVESFDSRELLCNYGGDLRPAVAKSYSFGGYTATAATAPDTPVIREDGAATASATVDTQQACRVLSKQDSNCSSVSVARSSPTSSGYKSQQSLTTAPSPSPILSLTSSSRLPVSSSGSSSSRSSGSSGGAESATAHPPEWASREEVNVATTVDMPSCTGDHLAAVDAPTGATLLWAVTSLEAVPVGSILINPQSGQPFYNVDGSVYRYDPAHPLPFQMESEMTSAMSVTGSELSPATATTLMPVDAASYDSYDQQMTKSTDNYQVVAPTATVFPSWPPSYYDNPTMVTIPQQAHHHQQQAQQPHTFVQPYYGEFHPLNAASNGYYLASSEDQLKTLAVPVAQGQGYVVYQACVTAPDPACAAANATECDVNPLMKSMSLRPVLPVGYPQEVQHQFQQQQQQLEMGAYTVPVRTTMVKVQQQQQVPSAGRAAFSPPLSVPVQAAANSYVTSIRVHNSGHMMPSYPNGSFPSPYPMMYPVPSSPANGQSAGQQHYISASVVHHYNNAQYVGPPRPVVISGTPTGTRCRTPDRDVVAGDFVRMMPSSRFPFTYGSTLSPSVVAGDVRPLRPSAAHFQRQYSLPAASSPALYTLRPRLQQQLTLGAPAMTRSAVTTAATATLVSAHHQQQDYYSSLSSRPPRMRRQSSRQHHLNNSTPSTTPTPSCSSSPTQHQHLHQPEASS